jgi:hypothetical protein
VTISGYVAPATTTDRQGGLRKQDDKARVGAGLEHDAGDRTRVPHGLLRTPKDALSVRSSRSLLDRRLRPDQNWMWHGVAKTCAGPVETKQFERRVSHLKRPAEDPHTDPDGQAKQDAHDHREQRRFRGRRTTEHGQTTEAARHPPNRSPSPVQRTGRGTHRPLSMAACRRCLSSGWLGRLRWLHP